MQARFIHDGKSIDFFPTTDTPAGTVVVLGSLVGVTKLDVKAGSLGAVAVVGVYDVEKTNVAVPLGAKVYWDPTHNKATPNANGIQIGVAVLDATAEDETVRVRLHPIEDTNVPLPAETRYRYGAVTVMEATAPLSVAVQPGDLLYQESGSVKPASSQPNQTTKALNQSTFASKFIGVALDGKPVQTAGDTERTIRIATSGVFQFDTNAATYPIGALVGIEELPERVGVHSQKVAPAVASGGVGYVVRREPVETDSVYVQISPKAWRSLT